MTQAYELAASQHDGQVRRSGEAYLSHPLAVARIVAEQTQDPVAIAAALLHDVVEDTDLSLDDLRRHFPAAVAEIVDGVTKVERTLFATKEAQQAATMRKLVVAMADDLRVLIIKLADRLHNMRTLAAMPVEKQHAIARETFDVYAPLALRLGHGRRAHAARGPRLRRPAPQVVRRDRPDGLEPHARARGVPHAGGRGGAHAPRGGRASSPR